MDKSTDINIIFCNNDNFQNAEQIAKILVSERIAACVSIIPNVTSIYIWEGSINQRNEYTLMIKTTKDNINEIEKRIIELHPDKVPEILTVGIENVNSSYKKWFEESLSI